MIVQLSDICIIFFHHRTCQKKSISRLNFHLTGTLMDCYDELGTHYQLPVYCLSPPVNLIKDESVTHKNIVVELRDIADGDP